jgi:hypothetical protein
MWLVAQFPAPLRNLAASVDQPACTHRRDADAGLVEYGQVGSAKV